MERLLNPTGYAGLGILLTFSLFPGVSMVSVKGSDTMLVIVCIIYSAILIATIVAGWLTFKNKLTLAPKWMVTTVMLLLLPYYSALSTAIDSFGDGNSSGNYWIPISEVFLILITAYVLRKNERRQALGQ